MCGIFAIYHPEGCAKFSVTRAQELSARQRHRGPDFHGLYQHPGNGNILAHERLAIMDLSCVQPLRGTTEEHQVIHNGEIYNWRFIRDGPLAELCFSTTCDSEAILKLYEKMHDQPEFEHELCLALDGVFAFAVIYGDEFMAARDPIGVKPLYWGTDAGGRKLFSSEMKVIEDSCVEMAAFPPGHFYTPRLGLVRYYEPDWFRWEMATGPADLLALRHCLIAATEKRLMSDAPIGVLLSGGLDSSLISTIAARALRGSDHPLRSFSIGLDREAPDAVAARKIAHFLGTQHHECYFSVQEGIEVITQLIWHLETYDVTSIRASTPMYFLSRHISKMGIKVVLSGEGADEIFGGYLYFHNAPDDAEFQKETIRRVNRLSTADCLRADKSTMANSLEVRVPFLDKQFLALAMSIAPAHKRPKMEPGKTERPMEKWILRKAFEDKDDPFLPDEILWRQKEQFSDGVGYGWIDELIDHCSAQISDEEMANASAIFPHNTPATKEAFFVRKIFHKHFPSNSATQTVLKWVPKWQKNEDPSGRANAMHEQAKVEEAEGTNNTTTTTTTTSTTMDGHCVGGHPEECKQKDRPEEVGSDLSPTNEVQKGTFGERCQLS
uniref:Asparagine synthetase [glutamine-hydrolyzing] n=1 Tax=Globodera rostochiensis TaxID=31243 RepID=A0A914IDQ2_GLORO